MIDWESLPRFKDYARFHGLALQTNDVDPVYPVLRQLAPAYGPEGMAWLALLHVAYYDLGSALRAYWMLGGVRPNRDKLDLVLRLPTGVERRGNRSTTQLLNHLCALIDLGEHYGDHFRAIRSLAESPLDGSPRYGRLLGGMLSVRGNGRWAAYKTCELMAHALHPFLGPNSWQLEPTDMAMRHSTGPRKGLALLEPSLPTNDSYAAVARLDAAATSLVSHLAINYVSRWGLWHTSHATVETTLCDFHSLVEGRYYVGHDIDQLRYQLMRAMAATYGHPLHSAISGADEVARKALEPYWGHVPDKLRKTHYLRTGEILTR